MSAAKPNRRGFTLIELLVVIAIIAILAAILFPVFAVARERARQTACLSNSKQLATAWHMYAQDYDEMLPMYANIKSPSNTLLHAWQWAIMPYVKSPQVFVCPSAVRVSPNNTNSCDPTYVRNSEGGTGSGSYGYNYVYLGDYSVSGGVYFGRAVSLAAIAKPAETIALTEITAHYNTGATYPPSLWSNTTTSNCGGTFEQNFSTRHMEGNNIVFTDGHAKWMKKSSVRDSDGNGTADNGWYDLS